MSQIWGLNGFWCRRPIYNLILLWIQLNNSNVHDTCTHFIAFGPNPCRQRILVLAAVHSSSSVVSIISALQIMHYFIILGTRFNSLELWQIISVLRISHGNKLHIRKHPQIIRIMHIKYYSNCQKRFFEELSQQH